MSAIFYISYIAMWILVLVEGLLLLLVYRHFGLNTLGTAESIQRDGLPLGRDAISFVGISSQGNPVQWIHKPGYSTFLAFVSPDCGPCEHIIPFILKLASSVAEIEVVMVVPGSQSLVAKLNDQFCLPSSIICLGEGENHIYDNYRVRVTPFAFMIGADGRIHAKGLCDSIEKIQALIAADSYSLFNENFVAIDIDN